MKILCVIPTYYPAFKFGGPIFSTHGLNKSLVKKGFEVTVYTTDAGLRGKVSANTEVDVDGVKVWYFTFAGLFEFLGSSGWQFSLPMTRALGKNVSRFDLIYIVSVWNYPVAAAAYFARKHKKPYIICPSGILSPYALRKKQLKKRLYYALVSKRDIARANAIHYTSSYEAETCHERLMLKNRAAIVPNGIDLSEFRDLPAREMLESSYPCIRNKKVVLFLGRIDHIKGLCVLAKAYGSIARTRDDIHLLIAGEGKPRYHNKVRNRFKEEGVLDKVTFCGMLTGRDRLAAYAASDVFSLPSYSESFGMAAVEAMACGLPVVLSNKVGIYREVKDAGGGVIIDTKAKALSGALISLLRNPDTCKGMGENGRRLVQGRFSLDNVVEEMIKMYRETVNAE
ncbi:MAG: glycosyltransferase [Candidatus Omnitrophica bacterium]|nr:glycosyltransferase [Candidatus Omnitrophota bacterium]